MAGIFILLVNTLTAQRVNVYPKNSYVEENLDLNAVSTIFSESVNTADFETRLNYPDYRISNLDLNHDGKVDYLRVIEKIQNNIKIIIIQSEIKPNIYEDVATINIVMSSRNTGYSTDSGIRPKDIIIPFVFTVLDVFLHKR
ncbi:hypothetical protein [Flavobacterium ginsenosidimutans]|uniref:hypothetical protein n=1 Tax=Flavobacterium ginsenosidimutans TaxID=687844 RepID=UPI0013A673DE|nr:hypothetical protein [Flavobacterium ginsenosidimutans]KAF2328669.1 hypothetical protein DM444_16495 [Flavobacterium ginsenosidimutans]